MPAAKQALDYPKFKALVHYICAACDSATLGSVKLNKVLWYSDLIRYMEIGSSITGETYIKRQFGPCSIEIGRAIHDLQEAKALLVNEDPDYYGYKKWEFISLKRPDLSRFTGDEIALVDRMIEHCVVIHTATSISQETHDEIWKMAAIGEVIPYAAVFVSRAAEINERDLNWARSRLEARRAAGG